MKSRAHEGSASDRNRGGARVWAQLMEGQSMWWWEDCCCLPVVRDLKERDASLTSCMSQSTVRAGSWGCRMAVVGGITSKV